MLEKASVIIPVYNGLRWGDGIVESISTNEAAVGEIILINDGEKDDFGQLLKKLQNELKVAIRCFHTLGRQGPAVARNKGLDNASCPYITFLDCDDVWLPDSLRQRIQLLKDNSSAPFAYCSTQFMNESGELLNKYQVPVMTSLYTLLVTNYISLPSVVIRRSFLGDMRFPIRGHEDYALWLNLLRIGSSPAVGMQEIGMKVRISFGSVSSNKTQAAHWHFDILKSFGMPLLIRVLLFIGYAMNGVLKKKLKYHRPVFFGLDYIVRFVIGRQ